MNRLHIYPINGIQDTRDCLAARLPETYPIHEPRRPEDAAPASSPPSTKRLHVPMDRISDNSRRYFNSLVTRSCQIAISTLLPCDSIVLPMPWSSSSLLEPNCFTEDFVSADSVVGRLWNASFTFSVAVARTDIEPTSAGPMISSDA